MNYKTLANKGRYGDSEIRNVAGRLSHVNPKEAEIIDLWGALGESLVQKIGSGTTNPETGMPEYDSPGNVGHDTGDNAGRPHTHTKYQDEGGNYRYSTTYTDTDSDGSGLNITHEGDLAEIIGAIMRDDSYDPTYDFNDDGRIDVLDITAGIAAGEYDESDYIPFDPTIDGEFAPSKDEFKQFIKSGNIDELIAGFGGEWTEADFADVLDMDKLGFLQEGYDLQTGKLESDKTITGGILQSNLESAKGQYGRGLQTAGYNVGQSLFDIKGQVEGQKSKGGFAGSGYVAATGKRAKRGLFQDYRTQQRELSAGLGEAKTAFDWGTERMTADYGYGMDMARLGLKTDIHDFWSDKYSAFYDRLWGLETGTFGG